MKFKKELIIGFVIIVGIALLIFGMSYLKGINPFSENRKFYAVYNNVEGLSVSNPVKVNGLKVGQITNIYFDANNLNRQIVEFVIDNENVKIPENSTAKIVSFDFLGSMGISLEMANNTNYLVSGDTLLSDMEATITDQVNETIAPLKEKTNQLLGSIDTMVQVITSIVGGETFQTLDESFEASIRDIRNAIQSFERTAHSIDTMISREQYRISNILGNINDVTATFAGKTKQVDTIIDNFTSISNDIASIDIAATVKELQNTVNQLNALVQGINNGEGSLGALVKEEDFVNSLKQTNEEVQRLIENIKEHPNRYIQFSIFGGKEKGLKLDARDEKKLKQFIKDSLSIYYP